MGGYGSALQQDPCGGGWQELSALCGFSSSSVEEGKEGKEKAQLAAWFALPSKLPIPAYPGGGGSAGALLRLCRGGSQVLRCTREKPRVLVLSDRQGVGLENASDPGVILVPGSGASSAGPSPGRGLQAEDVANTILGKMKKRVGLSLIHI